MYRNFALALLTASLAIGCANDRPTPADTVYLGGFHRQNQPQRANFDNVSYWDGDNASGSPAIKISLGEQRAYFYKGGELVGISVVSTGREGFGTSAGNFKIIQKDKDHVSSRFGDYLNADGSILKKMVQLEAEVPSVFAHRADVHRALMGAIEPGRVHLNKNCTGVQAHPDEAEFSPNISATGTFDGFKVTAAQTTIVKAGQDYPRSN